MRALGTLCAVLLLPAGAWAGIVRAASPADVSFGLAIDWAALPAGAVTQPVGVAMSSRILATVSLEYSTDFIRTEEGPEAWTGNFTAGTAVLWTNLDPGPVRFDFNYPIQAFGLHIQPNFGGGPPAPPFTATLEAFNFAGASLGTVSADGYSTLVEDGSALFLGFLSTAQDVSRVEVGVVDEIYIPSDFAIDGPVGAESVPEPAGMWLSSGALVLLASKALVQWRSLFARSDQS